MTLFSVRTSVRSRRCSGWSNVEQTRSL